MHIFCLYWMCRFFSASVFVFRLQHHRKNLKKSNSKQIYPSNCPEREKGKDYGERRILEMCFAHGVHSCQPSLKIHFIWFSLLTEIKERERVWKPAQSVDQLRWTFCLVDPLLTILWSPWGQLVPFWTSVSVTKSSRCLGSAKVLLNIGKIKEFMDIWYLKVMMILLSFLVHQSIAVPFRPNFFTQFSFVAQCSLCPAGNNVQSVNYLYWWSVPIWPCIKL